MPVRCPSNPVLAICALDIERDALDHPPRCCGSRTFARECGSRTSLPPTATTASCSAGGSLGESRTGSAQAGRLHRIDEEYARQDFEKHGFRLVAQSDVLRRPDDPRELLTYQGEMVGKTDRFVMVLRQRPAAPAAGPKHRRH